MLAEVRAERVGREPAQIAALAAAIGVFRRFLGHGLEVGAAGDAGAQRFDLGLGGRVGLRIVDPDQDVAGVVLGDRLLFRIGRGVAHFDQLQQLEAAGAAQRAGDLARLHVADQLRERVGDLVQAAPAQVAAFQRVGAVGIAHRRGVEIDLALVDQVLDPVDLALGGLDLLGGGAFRQADQDVRQVVLGAGGGLLRQGRVDFGLADVDAALRKALAQALHGDFVAHRVAEVGVGHAVGGQLLAQAVHVGAVLLGDAGDGAVQFVVADADAGAVGARDLQLDQDQAFQHLPLQHVIRRQLRLAAGILRLHVAHGTIQFALQYDILVDHRGDAVQRLGLLRGGRSGHAGDRHQGGEKNRKGLGHGIWFGS
ncbi:hypothetical protein NB689_002496 [Xanthomonas sacchari]|nr:hypothetical protein [Xanthomonas sacchari]